MKTVLSLRERFLPEAISTFAFGNCFAKNARNDTHPSSFRLHPLNLEAFHSRYLQTITIPTPFPVGPINCYLAEGDELTLIDTGPNHPATLSALRAGLNARGLAFKDIRHIIVTHAHVDHFGLPRKSSPSPAHASGRTRAIAGGSLILRTKRIGGPISISTCSPRAARRASWQTRRRAEWRRSCSMLRLFRRIVLVPLDDGDTISLGGDVWRVVYAPGHASGLICLYEPQSRTLISSDHLLRRHYVESGTGAADARRKRTSARARQLCCFDAKDRANGRATRAVCARRAD